MTAPPMPTHADILAPALSIAPLALQDEWDNSGLQVGQLDAECTGVLLAVDATPEAVDEAADAGLNLLLTHHPLIFRPLRAVTPDTRVGRTVIRAISRGVTIFSLHTPVDRAPGGISAAMAARLGLTDVRPLVPAPGFPAATHGYGAVGTLPEPLSLPQLAERVRRAFGSPVARCSAVGPAAPISRVALCGGSGSSFIADAVAAGAQAMVTSDTTYHTFVDTEGLISIIDIGHFESEECVRAIFYQLITEKFPNFAVRYASEHNPTAYL